MPDDPWAQFRVNTPSAAPSQAPKAPGVIYGAPKQPDQPTSLQMEDQQMQRAREERARKEWEASHNPDGTKKPDPTGTDFKPTEFQSKSASFYERMLRSEDAFKSVPEGSRDARTVPGEWLRQTLPGVDNTLNSSDRQVADQAAMDFIRASLRQESGAAVNKDEEVKQYRIFYPMPGDGPEVLKQKALARKAAMEGMRISAGPLADRVVQSYAKLKEGDDPQSGDTIIPNVAGSQPPAAIPPNGGGGPGGTRVPEMVGDLPKGADIQFGMDTWGTGDSFDRNKALKDIYGITPNQEASIVAFWQANVGNPGLSADAARQFYQSQGIDPAKFDIEGTVEQVKSADPANTNITPYDLSNEEKAYKAALDATLKERGSTPDTAGGAFSSHAQQGSLMGAADEIAGAGGFAKALFTGRNPVRGYQFERDVARRDLERGANAHPKLSFGAEIAGSILTGKAGFGKVETLAEAAKAGGKMGALAGFNYGEGVGGSALGAAGGAALGAPLAAGVEVAAPYIGKGLNAVRNAVGPKAIAPDVAAAGQEVIQAGARQDVPIRQPDVRPELRGKMGVVEKTDAGGPIIRGALSEDNAAMEAAVSRIGGDRAAPDRIGAGSMAQDALDRTSKASSTRGSSLYTRAARIAGNVEVKPSNAVAEIDRQIADLIEKGEKTNSGTIAYLNDLKSDLTKGGPVSTGVLDGNGKMITRPPKGLSIDTVRSLRTDARGQINERNLGMTDAERRVSSVIAAANSDIEAALQNNPRALEAFQNADKYWRGKKDFEKQVSDRLLGPDNNRYGPEKTTAALESMMKPGGDMGRFQRWHNTLEPEEKADWAASVAENLGRNAKGEFSLPIFLNNTGPKGTLSPRAAEMVFGKDGVKALNDLKAIARAKVAAQSERNYSGTSGAVNKMAGGFRTMMLSALGFASGDATGAIAGGVAGHLIDKIGSKRAARMLMNPDFTKWLRAIPDTADPAVIDRQFRRLQSVASRSPVMAADVLSLQNSLREAFTQPMKAAAEQDDNR